MGFAAFVQMGKVCQIIRIKNQLCIVISFVHRKFDESREKKGFQRPTKDIKSPNVRSMIITGLAQQDLKLN